MLADKVRVSVYNLFSHLSAAGGWFCWK